MAKFVCNVCGYVFEGDAAPAECPVCHAPASKFTKQEGEMTWAAEHVVSKFHPAFAVACVQACHFGQRCPLHGSAVYQHR